MLGKFWRVWINIPRQLIKQLGYCDLCGISLKLQSFNNRLFYNSYTVILTFNQIFQMWKLKWKLNFIYSKNQSFFVWRIFEQKKEQIPDSVQKSNCWFFKSKKKINMTSSLNSLEAILVKEPFRWLKSIWQIFNS